MYVDCMIMWATPSSCHYVTSQWHVVYLSRRQWDTSNVKLSMTFLPFQRNICCHMSGARSAQKLNTYIYLLFYIYLTNHTTYIGCENVITQECNHQWNPPLTSSPWIWKGVSATSQSGRYTLAYPKGRYTLSLYSFSAALMWEWINPTWSYECLPETFRNWNHYLI